MSLLSLAIFNLSRKRALESFRTFLEGNPDEILRDNIYTMLYMIILLLVTTIPAVLVATNCNKNNQVLYGILAFLFSDIYLLQWSIKKFVIKYPDYCPL
tara:strand:- start:1451 stop:1747 length:297 start_codon:yes stop_codon:yes gene_type:complete